MFCGKRKGNLMFWWSKVELLWQAGGYSGSTSLRRFCGRHSAVGMAVAFAALMSWQVR